MSIKDEALGKPSAHLGQRCIDDEGIAFVQRLDLEKHLFVLCWPLAYVQHSRKVDDVDERALNICPKILLGDLHRT